MVKNEIKTLIKEYDGTLKMDDESIEIKTMRQPITLVCSSCNTNRISTVKSVYESILRKTLSCKKCESIVPRTHKTHDFDSLKIRLKDSPYINTEHKHTWECMICGTEFVRKLNDQKQKFATTGRVGCSIKCTNLLNYGTEDVIRLEFINNLNNANSQGFKMFILDEDEYSGKNVKIDFLCQSCGVTHHIPPSTIDTAIKTRTNACRKCINMYEW